MSYYGTDANITGNMTISGSLFRTLGGTNGAGINITTNAIRPTNYLGVLNDGIVSFGDATYSWNTIHAVDGEFSGDLNANEFIGGGSGLTSVPNVGQITAGYTSGSTNPAIYSQSSLLMIEAKINNQVFFNKENYVNGSVIFCGSSTNTDGTTSSAIIRGRSQGSYSAEFGNGCTRQIKVRGMYSEDSANKTIIKVTPTHATYTESAHLTEITRASSSDYWFAGFRNSGSSNNSFYFRGDGTAVADGSWTGGGADYAEYFESSNGLTIPLGKCVVIEPNNNNKVCLIREYKDSDLLDDIIGVVRAKRNCSGASFVGNNHDDKWKKKYLTNGFGEYIMEDYNVYKWIENNNDGEFVKEHSYNVGEVPDEIIIPDDVETIILERRKLNPDFDENLKYISYENRDEKILVALVGQIQKLKDGISKTNWKKCYDIDDDIEMYYIK
jgi:hypothetical protein